MALPIAACASSCKSAGSRAAIVVAARVNDRHDRPDDPNVIAFEVARLKVYVLPWALLTIGVVFLAFGLMTRRMSRVCRT